MCIHACMHALMHEPLAGRASISASSLHRFSADQNRQSQAGMQCSHATFICMHSHAHECRWHCQLGPTPQLWRPSPAPNTRRLDRGNLYVPMVYKSFYARLRKKQDRGGRASPIDHQPALGHTQDYCTHTVNMSIHMCMHMSVHMSTHMSTHM